MTSCSVVYFDQGLGAAHSEHWSNYKFFVCCVFQPVNGCSALHLLVEIKKKTVFMQDSASNFLLFCIFLAFTDKNVKNTDFDGMRSIQRLVEIYSIAV